MEVNTLFDISPFVMASVPFIIGIVQLIKNAFGLSDRYAPVVSLACGVLAGIIACDVWQVIVVQGMIAGLMASGLYSGGKAIVKG